MRKKEKIKSLESRIERLESQLSHKQDDYDYILEYIKEAGEVSWKQFAKDFERCEHCGFDYESDLESHSNYSQECPEAFSQMCEDFIDEIDCESSTRESLLKRQQVMNKGRVKGRVEIIDEDKRYWSDDIWICSCYWNR